MAQDGDRGSNTTVPRIDPFLTWDASFLWRFPGSGIDIRLYALNLTGTLPVWSKYSKAQRVSSLHLSKGRLNPPSRSDTDSSSAEGVAMDWKTMLTYISGSVDEELLLRNKYLVAENPVPRNQIQGRLRLTDAKRPGAPVLSPFVFWTRREIAPYSVPRGPSSTSTRSTSRSRRSTAIGISPR